MHVIFDPNSVNWSALINNADGKMQIGGSYNIFHGMPYQRGVGLGSLFRMFYRALLPLGREVGSALARQGLESTQNILTGLREGKPFKEAVVEETRSGVKNLVNQAADKAADESSTQLKKIMDKISKKPIQEGEGVSSYKKTVPSSLMQKRFGFKPAKRPAISRPTTKPHSKKPSKTAKKKRLDALRFY